MRARRFINLLQMLGFAAIMAFPAFGATETPQYKDTLLQNELAEKAHTLLSAFPGLKGSIRLSVTITRNGAVSLAETSDVRLNDTEPVTSILETVYKWKFTASDTRPASVTLNEKLQFSPIVNSTRVFFVLMGAFIASLAVLLVIRRI